MCDDAGARVKRSIEEAIGVLERLSERCTRRNHVAEKSTQSEVKRDRREPPLFARVSVNGSLGIGSTLLRYQGSHEPRAVT